MRSRAVEAANEAGHSALLSMAVAFAATGACVFAIVYGGLPMVWLPVLAAAVLMVVSPTTYLAVLLVSIVFQNAMLGLVVTEVQTQTEFQAAQAVNFLFLAVGAGIAGVSILNSPHTSGFFRRLMWPLLAFSAATVLLAVVGIALADFASAAAYLRVFLVPVMAVVVGLHLSSRVTLAALKSLVSLLALLLLVWATFELVWMRDVYEAFNLGPFQAWKTNGGTLLVDAEMMVSNAWRSWLNLTGQYRVQISLPRMFGPTVHPISFAYVISFTAIALVYLRRMWLALALLPLLVLVGAKGPLVAFVFPFAIYLLVRFTRSSRMGMQALIFLSVGYVGAVVLYGLRSRDIHVLGLISGFMNFPTHPAGHGVGVGGNLSSLAKAGRDYATIQKEGAAYALESAIGVVLYQMGIFCAPLFIAFARLGGALKEFARTSAEDILLLSYLVFLACNALFQEEVFSPVAGGLAALLIGLIVAKRVEEQSKSFNRSARGAASARG
jgi:hypothetical protein